MRFIKNSYLKILYFFLITVIYIPGFSQVPGVDPNTDVREVTDNNFDGLPKTTMNLDFLLSLIDNTKRKGDPKTKFYIGSSTITTEKMKGPRILFDNDVLRSLVVACKAYNISSLDFQVATINSEKDIARNLKHHADLSPDQGNLLAGKKTVLIRVPTAVLTGKSSTGFIALNIFYSIESFSYVEIGQICPPPPNCSSSD